MSTLLVTYPSTLAVSVASLKSHLRLDTSDEDTLLEEYLRSAQRYCEAYARRSFVTITYKRVLDAFPACNGKIELHNGPLASVTSLQYVASDGTLTTLATDQYDVITDDLVGYVRPKYGIDWPDTRDESNAVRVTYTTGYSSVPDQAKQAIRLLASKYFVAREAFADPETYQAVHWSLDQIAIREVV